MSVRKSGTGLILLVFFILVFQSCEFEPDKVYMRSVNENIPPPEIQVVELNLDYDTVYLYTGKKIHFSFVSDNQEIKAVRFVIDGLEKYLVYSSSGVFDLDYNSLTYGIHTLLMEVYTASGTGSIAEILGKEAYIASKSWILNVMHHNYSTNLSTDVIDGLMRLSWEKYLGHDFKEYMIYRQPGWENTEIARVTTNYFIDRSYVGEVAIYKVSVCTDDSTIIPWGYGILIPELPKLYFSASETNQFTVKWDKSRFYGAVDSVRLFLSTNYGVTYSLVKASGNPDDTTYVITTAFFGDVVDLKLRVVPKNNIHYKPENFGYFESFLTRKTLGLSFGNNFKRIYRIRQVSQDEFIYIEECDSIIRYSVSQKRVTGKFGYELTGCYTCKFTDLHTSPSGRFFTSFVGCNDDVMMANSVNPGDNIIRNVQHLSCQYCTSPIPISDAAVGIVNKPVGRFYLYDFNSNSTLGFYSKENYEVKGLAISVNGDYVFLKDDSLHLVSFKNFQFNKIWSQSINSEPKFYEFDGLNPERLVTWNGSLFSVKNCSDFLTVYEFTINERMILDIDYYNNEILTWSPGHLYIRSFSDGSLLHDLRFNPDPANWDTAVQLVNHAIVSMSKIIYFLE